MTPLSTHARALADELADGDNVAMVPIPTAALAAEEGMPTALWMSFRAEVLLSVGTAVAELRRAGWQLTTRHLTGAEVGHSGAERVVVVEAKRIPDGASP
jgi:hypothetical protein